MNVLNLQQSVRKIGASIALIALFSQSVSADINRIFETDKVNITRIDDTNTTKEKECRKGLDGRVYLPVCEGSYDGKTGTTRK